MSIFIDRTKSITSQVNRLTKGSCDIYLEENIITQPEMRHTTPLKLKLIGSKTNLKLTGQDLNIAMFQSSKIQISFTVNKKARGIKKNVYLRRNTELIEEGKGLKSMVK